MGTAIWQKLDPEDSTISARDLLGALVTALETCRAYEHARGLEGIAVDDDDVARRWQAQDQRWRVCYRALHGRLGVL